MADRDDGKIIVAAGVGGLAGAGLATLFGNKPVVAAPGEVDLTAIETALNKVNAGITQLINLQGQPGQVIVSVLTPWMSKEPELIFSQPILSVGTFRTDKMVDCRGAKRIYLKVESSLDQVVTLQPIGNMDENFILATNIGLPTICGAGANASFGLSGQNWAPFIGMTMTTAIAPTTGILNVWIILQE